MSIYLHSLWRVCLIYAAGLLSPGPNFLVIANQAFRGSRREAMATAAGVVTVNALWAFASLLGIDVLFRLFPLMFVLLRSVGAVYLFLMGIRLWQRADTTIGSPDGSCHVAGIIPAFRNGLATNLSNFKAVAFYGAAFSTVAPSPQRPLTLWFALGLVLLFASIWYGLAAAVLSTLAIASESRRWSRWIQRLGATAMIGFGLALVLDDSPF